MEDNRMDLGSFEVTSGRIIVSDPCYAKDIWCCNELKNAQNGTWSAYAVYDNSSIYAIIQKLVIECDDAGHIQEGMEMAPFTVGVDSGQAGFFDAVHYRDERVIDPDCNSSAYAELWYKHCCEITLARFPAGVLPFGVVSSSGYGDGEYNCYLQKSDQGKVIRVSIDFVDTDMEDDWDEEEGE